MQPEFRDPPPYRVSMHVNKKPRVVLVHGIHTKEGTSNVRKLVPYFEAEGFDVLVFEYGWLGVLGARWRNPGIARRLASVVRPSDHLVCHSNGATVAWMAMENHSMRCERASLIAPALDSDEVLYGAWHTDVYHNACDHVVWFARLLIHHAWGSMGRDGATNVLHHALGMHNIDVANHAGMPQICGHLEYFEPHVLPRFAPWLVRRHLERA